MKITLRKKDSVIGSTLFLFNLMGEYKKDYSIKLRHLLELMQYFGKSEASVRTGLSRMVKSGLLLNSKDGSETIYTLSHEGRGSIATWNISSEKFFRRYAQWANGWDKVWYFMTIFGFNKSDYNNQFIVECLEECGLRELGNNLWLSAYPIDGDALKLLEEQKYSYIKFTGDAKSNDDLYHLLYQSLDLNPIELGYHTFSAKAKTIINNLPKLETSELFSVLFDTGWDFNDLIARDPLLPKEFIPDWPGKNAVSMMQEIRSFALPKLIEFMKDHDI